MLDTTLRIAPWVILLAVPIALFGVLCRINRLQWSCSPKPIALSYVAIAFGWGAVFFGMLDYLMHTPPLYWPVFLLIGVMLLSGGNAGLFLADRRRVCEACPRTRC